MNLKQNLTLSATLLLMLGGAARAEVDAMALVDPVSEYKLFVSDRTEALVAGVREFTQAVKAGEIEKAKALFPKVRLPYEEIEPIAELFSDLDVSIDSRADDYELAEADPAFPGFHRIEYGLWEQNSTDGLEPIADKLMADVTELSQRIESLTFPPEKVFGGAAVLMEEVAATKISGEEDRYSHTDLWDFKGNTDGSHKILELARPLVAEDSAYLARVDANFASVYDTLKKYEEREGYVSYENLTDADRNTMAVAVNALAEDLSQLRGKLGLN